MSRLVIPTERDEILLHSTTNQLPNYINTAILFNATEVGDIGLDRMTPEAGSIGYTLLPEFEGNGYATVALKAITHYAFSKLGFSTLEVSTLPANLKSQRVAQRAGYELMSSHGGRLVFLRRLSNDSQAILSLT